MPVDVGADLGVDVPSIDVADVPAADVVDVPPVDVPFRCTDNASCAGNAGGAVCDATTGQCVQCLASADTCPAGSYCVAGSNRCAAGCRNDEGCAAGVGDAGMASGRRCDVSTRACVECVMDEHCPSGTLCVGNTCVVGCTATRACPAGQSCCSGACVDPLANTSHCGGCDMRCSLPRAAAACMNGVCAVASCTAPYDNCDGMAANGCETDTLNDVGHCGGCGVACATRANSAASCAAGRCAYACSAGFADCDANAANGCEVELAMSLTNCGACGRACDLANATAACTAGACAVASCAAGFGDCDGNAANGCETDTRTSAIHCGACGTTCAMRSNAVLGVHGVGVHQRVRGGLRRVQRGCDRRLRDQPRQQRGALRRVRAELPHQQRGHRDLRGERVHHHGLRRGLRGLRRDGRQRVRGRHALHRHELRRLRDGVRGAQRDADVYGRAMRDRGVRRGLRGLRRHGRQRVRGRHALGRHELRRVRDGVLAAQRHVGLRGERACTVAACGAGFGDCDGMAANGCEVDTATAVANCGTCGRACSSAQSCVAGACTLPRSCAEIRARVPSAATGVFDIDPDGAGGADALRVYCDMTSSGGGWTLVLMAGTDVAGTLGYNSALWTGTGVLNGDVNDVARNVSMKNTAFNTLGITAVRMCLNTLGACLEETVAATSARALFSGAERLGARSVADFATWGYSGNLGCNRRGFNVLDVGGGPARCRYGILLNNESACEGSVDGGRGLGCHGFYGTEVSAGRGDGIVGTSHERAWLFVR
ncbi:MAG: hypothetical protein IPF99_32365 [Deltaproteobacteria bacterium]|nr:hypothetical protein [Deltaproteobacteria bacterium]